MQGKLAEPCQKAGGKEVGVTVIGTLARLDSVKAILEDQAISVMK